MKSRMNRHDNDNDILELISGIAQLSFYRLKKRAIRYATVCSGIEGVSLAWESLGGFDPVFFSEIEAFPKALLFYRFPHVPDLGDLTKIEGGAYCGAVDVLWGSTPCQSFSMAGSRLGAADPRGAITMGFVKLANEINPAFTVWENVKGVFNDKQNAFGCFLGAMAGEDGPLQPSGGQWTNAGFVRGPQRAIAWRTFNAQYGGVAQRRERVFLVACDRASGHDPRDILFEREGHRRDSAPVYQHEEEAASGAGGGVVFVNGDSRPKISERHAYTLKADTSAGSRACVVQNGRLRRLTAREWERLQGMPDDWTLIPWGKGMAPDTLRKRAIGNSLAIPDVRWIGTRIKGALDGSLILSEWAEPDFEVVAEAA
jgi:DNA (cytosine-5)-methyltransferase 1